MAAPVRTATLMMLLVLGACTGHRAPEVSIVGSRVVEVGPEAVRVDVDLDLHNPNATPLELLEVEYGFVLDGVETYRARWSAEATLAPRSDRRLSVPAILSRIDPGTALPDRWRVSGRVLYVAPGEMAEILLDLGVRRPKAEFAGSLPLDPAVRDALAQ